MSIGPGHHVASCTFKKCYNMYVYVQFYNGVSRLATMKVQFLALSSHLPTVRKLHFINTAQHFS